MIATTETVDAYLRSWNADDARARGELLARCWAETGRYLDPRNRAEGREALGALIRGYRERNPGTSFQLTSGVDAHDDVLRFHWAIVEPQA